MAKVNKVALPDGLDAKLLSADDDDEQTDPAPQGKMWNLLASRTIITRIMILGFNWCTISMVYYGLTYGVGDLIEGSLFVNFSLQSLMELLAYAICLVLMEKVGRKKLYCGSMLLSGLSCLASAGPVFANKEIVWLDILLFCVGKFGITAAFCLIYVVTAELLPTVLRNSGLGLCSFIGRIGSIISPYIASMGDLIPGPFGHAFSFFVFGLFSLLAGLTSLSLPETRNRKLPETIEDMNNFGKDKPKQLNIQEAV